MIANPFIRTMLNEEYRSFLLTSFNPQLIPEYFQGWDSIDMGGWCKITTVGVELEFKTSTNQYKIKFGGNIYLLPIPKNLDDFICDCNRCSVNLIWNFNIVQRFGKKCLNDRDNIQGDIESLLKKIDKD
jgi:hypothetical protein